MIQYILKLDLGANSKASSSSIPKSVAGVIYIGPGVAEAPRALLYLEMLASQIFDLSSASSKSFLYDLIFCCSLSTRSVMRSWFFLFSSCWKRSSLTRRSPLVMVLCTSSVCWMVLFSSASHGKGGLFCLVLHF